MTRESVELIDRIESRLEELADQVDRLQEFDETIEEHQERVEAMGEDDRRSFYLSVTTIRNRAEDADLLEKLIELEDEVTNAVQSPLQQAVRESIEEFLKLVDVDLEGDESELIFDRLKNKGPSGLDSLSAEYQNLTEDIDSMNDTAVEVIARVIEDKPSAVHDPMGDLGATVSRIRYRYDTLKKLEAVFDREYAGIPSFEFSMERRFYGERSKDNIDVEAIEECIDAIVEALTAFEYEEIQIESAVRNEFESWYESKNALHRLGKLERLLDSIVDIRVTYENVEIFLPNDGTFVEYTGEFQSQIRELHQSYDTLQGSSYDSLDEVQSHLADVDHLMKEFFEDLYQQLRTHRTLVDNVVEENPDLQEPDVNVIEQSLDKSTVKMHPYQALEDFQLLQSWIEDHLEAEIDTGTGGSIIEVWRRLSDGDSVKLTEENWESIVALANQVPVEVVVVSGE